MLPLFANYLTNLQAEIIDYEQQLTAKKQEAERLNGLEAKVGEALETLQNVVNNIKEVDQNAIALLKEAALSLFNGSTQTSIELTESSQSEALDENQSALVEIQCEPGTEQVVINKELAQIRATSPVPDISNGCDLLVIG